jgi:hypothetical protein
MDKRDTLVVHATFLEILQSIQSEHQKASLLVDNNGIGREEGKITQISRSGNDTLVHLDNGKVIDLKTIIAVNGTFLSDYSEC